VVNDRGQIRVYRVSPLATKGKKKQAVAPPPAASPAPAPPPPETPAPETPAPAAAPQ
jgi:hypothetical protein